MGILTKGVGQWADDDGFVVETASENAVINVEYSDGNSHDIAVSKADLPMAFDFSPHNRVTVKTGWVSLIDGTTATSFAAGTSHIGAGTELSVSGSSTETIQSGSGAAILKTDIDGVETEFYVRLNQLSYPFVLGVGQASPDSGDSVSLTPVGENSYVLHS